MILTLEDVTGSTATLHGDDVLVTVTCAHAAVIGAQIARAMRRDSRFDALVSALTVFRSTEMGNLLVDMIDIREPNGEEAQRKLKRLVHMIDVILDACQEQEDATFDA